MKIQDVRGVSPRTRPIVIAPAQMEVSLDTSAVLATYSLGSCIGLALYDPEVRVGGMIHCMLPLSKINPDKARTNPARFVDTGVPTLLQALFDHGAARKRIVAVAAGGGSQMDSRGVFNIGSRNYAVLRKVLWKNSILLEEEQVGGTISRSMYLHMATGEVIIKSKGKIIGGNTHGL